MSKNEFEVLDLLTKKNCHYSAQLDVFLPQEVDVTVPQRPDIGMCWFVMAWLDGVNLESILYPEKKSSATGRRMSTGWGVGSFAHINFSTRSVSNVQVSPNLKPVDAVECVDVARDVLAALKVLHSENWIHCDIKPANIVKCRTDMMSGHLDSQSEGGRMFYSYKLVDFGSALLLTDQARTAVSGAQRKEERPAVGSTSAAVTETVKRASNNTDGYSGPQSYTAPEMRSEPLIPTRAADIWSLGATMFELMTARQLPETEHHDEILACISDKQLQSVVQKALKKLLAERCSVSPCYLQQHCFVSRPNMLLDSIILVFRDIHP